jgi:hypothetical protein
MNPFELASGRLYHNSQDRTGGLGGWHGWQVDFQRAPEMFFITTVDRKGLHRFHMQAFGLGTDGTTYYNWMEGDGTWHEWKNMHWPKFRFFEAKNGNHNGILEVFALGYEDGAVYHNWQSVEDEQWSSWVPVFKGANPMRFLNAAVGATGRLEVFGVDFEDGTLSHNSLESNGAWHEWDPDFFRAPHVSAVEAVTGASRDLEVFLVGAADGTLYHNSQNKLGQNKFGEWGAWEPDFQAAPKVQSITAAVGSGPTLHVFAVTTDGSLAHLMQDSKGGWTTWNEDFLGGSPRVTFAKVVKGPQAQLALFAIRNDHVLLRTFQDNPNAPFMGWHPWEPHFNGAPLAGFVTGALGGGTAGTVGPHLEVFLISPPFDR